MRLINRVPQRGLRIALTLLPFAGLLMVYWVASEARLALNPDDKLLPSLGQMAETLHRYALQEDPRTGGWLLWDDTWASLRRLLQGMVVATCLALVAGIGLGAIRCWGPACPRP